MGTIINIKQTGRLGRQAASEDATTGLVLMVPAPGEGQSYSVLNGGVYQIGEVTELEDLGITEEFDEENEVNAWHVVKRFREISPNSKLFVMLVDQSVELADVLDHTNDTSSITRLLNVSEGVINQVGVAVSPSTENIPGEDNAGAPSDWNAYFETNIPIAQLAINHFASQGRPIVICIEATGTDANGDWSELSASGVAMMHGQNDYLYNKGTWARKHTCIGTLMGVIAASPVNANVGWVEKNNVKIGSLINARNAGSYVASITDAEIQAREERRHIFFIKYTDYPGIFLNNSFTCTERTDDYSSIERNRTWNKASRLIRRAILPFVNSTVFINAENGQIDSITVTQIENAGNKAIAPMFTNGEISGPDPQGATPPFTIDPAQDVIATDELITQLEIVPTGVASNIKNYIGFSNPNSN